tara:strand:+ start:6250 stop:6798 length:549 start_codon:yes stop_codon:yes gene_type:complete
LYIIAKKFSRFASLALLLILSGCSTIGSETFKVLDLNSRADQAYREKRCDEAITMYSRLAKQLPKNAESFLRIGNCHARNQRQNDAIAAYRNAVARDPFYTKAWHNLGLIQAQMLGQTMAEMGSYLDPADSSMDGMRILTQVVLDAFSITVKSELQQSISQRQDSSGETDINFDEEATVTDE